jgi:phosphatidate cytidylyltransferase
VIIFLAGIAGILGQLGDLWESVLKREAKVKVSGKCLPGHGGVLDRLDSLFVSAPFL